jgi:hypothetical protein
MKPYKIVPKESITFTHTIFVPKVIEIFNNYTANQGDFCILASAVDNSITIDLTPLETLENDGKWICIYFKQDDNTPLTITCTSIESISTLNVADESIELVYSYTDTTWYAVSSHNL